MLVYWHNWQMRPSSVYSPGHRAHGYFVNRSVETALRESRSEWGVSTFLARDNRLDGPNVDMTMSMDNMYVVIFTTYMVD